MDRFRYAALAAVIAGGLALSPVAFADTSAAQQAQALIDSGHPADSLNKPNDHLAKNPQDAEARFTKVVALVKLDRSTDAIRVLADLTRDYPQLPEPYNNLSVLYAAQADYDKARDALQRAPATHPRVAPARNGAVSGNRGSE